MHRIAIIAVMLLVFGVLVARHADRLGVSPTAPAAMTSTPAPVSASPSARNIVLSPGKGGHFQVEARIDGRRLEFVVDTGATHIALRESEAARLGLRPLRSDYTVNVSTANGVIKAALVHLRTVEIGDILVRDLTALVHPDEVLGVNLLGMSFLSRVRWTHDRGKLVLEQ